MNPFTNAHTDAELGRDRGFAGRLALLALVVALGFGLGLVWWKTHRSAAAARTAARERGLAGKALADSQLARPLGAAQTLAALARQGGGAIANFQRVGPDLLAAWPGLAWIDFEPGDVVADIVPRAGNERLLGLNVLRDPAQRAGALEAATRGVAAVCGPVALDRGERGLVVRLPVVVRTRRGV